MKNAIIYAGIATLVALSFSPAMAYDPTQSRWYKGTQWVDPTYRIMNRALKTPPRFAPRTYRPHYRAFRGGWSAGRQIERRTRSGDRLYRYLNKHYR